jgi:hypothetical protein
MSSGLDGPRAHDACRYQAEQGHGVLLAEHRRLGKGEQRRGSNCGAWGSGWRGRRLAGVRGARVPSVGPGVYAPSQALRIDTARTLTGQ